MKRPIAELLMTSLTVGAEAAHAQYEQETWQILRRKQGYKTHRIYHDLAAPLQRLVYSEWDSKKALDGARQHLHGTPLMRRGRATLAAAPRQVVVEITGPVTSTKGLELSPEAVALLLLARLETHSGAWQAHADAVWKEISAHTGHLATVVFHGFDDPALIGWLSHWTDAAALEHARAGFEATLARHAGVALATPPECTTYRRD